MSSVEGVSFQPRDVPTGPVTLTLNFLTLGRRNNGYFIVSSVEGVSS